ncbi:PREDICTED: uncharacterized protein LOC104728655 [Camelina sativa]|uniref:Uncharacterized protein LOC104728655 n=1 Tax=Camelina sativa TaxID=90675 RepID=A0ABM0UT55_CAMSA|nr:PREDICTED: uncharacterized protein LOC104728655 [Camelina sativa]
MMSQSPGSDANSSWIWGPLCCNCGKATTLAKSWTNENPGRKFVKCVVHGFVKWADEEKPYGWQKDLANKHEEEKKKLESEVMADSERAKMLRQFIFLSWGGFIVVIAMILVMGKI